ncbi:MAG: class I SAM-dependent methyltransferase [Roseiflexaceae bacterium]|nr:class I SAM-dependent methyltransferase [Roseiflexaceae bacterium]
MTNAIRLYNDIWGKDYATFEATSNISLNPRSTDMLYDVFATLGVSSGHTVLDIGCRDAKYAIEIVRRFGCQAIAADPVPLHMKLAHERVAEAGLGNQIRIVQSGIESLPLDDSSIDYVWCRDVLNHVDLAPGLAECARVLRSGGQMLAYQTFATELIEPHEAAQIYTGLAIVADNMSEAFFRATAESVGLTIATRDVIGSEWRERWAEEGRNDLANDLLWIARMRRREAELVARYGQAHYHAQYAGCLWGIYQMLGKLQPTVYVLEKH